MTVIGVGNTLMGDDGVAPRIIERLASRERKLAGSFNSKEGSRIEYLDGGVGGLRLLNWIEQAPRLLFVDAGRFGGPIGRCRLFRPEQVNARREQAPFSLHQTDLLGVLEMARRFGRCPPTWLLAVQVAHVEPSDRLSDALESALPRLAETVRRLARRLVRR